MNKFLLDENMSYKTADFLNNLKYNAKSAFDFNLIGASDEQIFNKAVSERRTVITLDSDFGQIFYFSSKKACSVIILKISDQTVENINQTLLQTLPEIKKLKLKNSLVIVDDRKMRVLKKP